MRTPLILALGLLFASCVTSADVRAQLEILEERFGVDAREEAEDQLSQIRLERAAAIASAVPGIAANPAGFLLEIVLGGALGAVGLNSHRNRKRRRRGEATGDGPRPPPAK